MREIRMHGSVRGIEVCFMVRYCGTFDTERQKKQRKQILPKKHDYIMSTRPIFKGQSERKYLYKRGL